jgi:glycerophosphoryl diester phosphodiesterase
VISKTRDGTGSQFPSVIGHRGAAGCAPENTLASLRRAKELGCRWVEFDVRLTADGHPVLLHDDRLDRTTDGRGRVSALSLAAVRLRQAGGWFDPAFAGERVPTLEEALMLLSELGLGANIELKAELGREVATGTIVADLVARTWRSTPSELLISSFRPGALGAAAARAPEISRGILFHVVPKDWRSVAHRLGCATINAAHRHLHPELVSEIRRAGYPLLAYTVNDAARARALFDWGVTSVFSDVPQRLLDAAADAPSRQPVIADLDSIGVPRQRAVS